MKTDFLVHSAVSLPVTALLAARQTRQTVHATDVYESERAYFHHDFSKKGMLMTGASVFFKSAMLNYTRLAGA